MYPGGSPSFSSMRPPQAGEKHSDLIFFVSPVNTDATCNVHPELLKQLFFCLVYECYRSILYA